MFDLITLLVQRVGDFVEYYEDIEYIIYDDGKLLWRVNGHWNGTYTLVD